METFIEIAYNIVLPIFLIAGIVVALDRVVALDPKTLSRYVIYLFTPFLIFDSMANTNLAGGDALKLVAVAWGMSLAVALIAWQAARLMRLDRRMESAFILACTLINAGNYGLPLNRFAFGPAGEERAVVFFTATAIISYTVGVFLASRGTLSTRAALMNVLRVPLVYAAALGVALNVGGITLDVPFQRAVSVLGQAAVPTMLAVLGMQLARASLRRDHLWAALAASGIRLGVAPAIAFGLALLLGMHGLTRDVAIVESALPTAVIGGVIATEFNGEAQFVTMTILLSTLLSLLTVSVLLTLIM